ncbi:MAG TPA: DUF86 domain-containing protein [Rhodospirillaceae bacterium]|nr:DUF86 domain-containing protein [Rhodospirillaceae bacterium]
MSSGDRRIDVDACLDDIQQNADAVERYVAGVSADQFAMDEMRQDAVVRRLEIIGEAADRLIRAVRDQFGSPRR